MTTVNSKTLDSGVLLIELGKPGESVVTLTHARMESLKRVLESVNSSTKGVIITGPGPGMFTAGADISAIQEITDPAIATRAAELGQELFSLIERLPCNTVAAISGPCVGGGCEMALACNVRLISDEPNSIIGLPEVKLGILPGFGGTQRLPRLVGLPKALDIILAGKTLRPKQALAVGLVNEIVPYDALIKRAERIASGKEKARSSGMKLLDRLLTYISPARNFVAKKAASSVKKQTKGFYPAPPAALESVMYGLRNGTKAGYEFEAKELGRLLVTPESKSLVHLFFLTEDAKSIGKSARASVSDVHALVIGAGVMGAGVAGVLAKNDCQVILKDTSEEGLKRGLSQIKKFVGKMRYLSEQERSFVLNRISTTTDQSPALANSNIVIEAVFEDLNLKQKIFKGISELVSEDAILASNTSSLSISSIAEGISNPERFVGMHFFNPVEKMPLVEIVRAERTSDRTLAVIAALTTKIGKFPIVVNDVPGFLVNRILTPYLNEAGHLLSEGFSIDDIDRAALDFGMPMGPIRLLDEVGLDVAMHVAEIMVAGYGERMKAPGHVKLLVEAGRKGKKSGKGFYDFGEDRSETPSPEAMKMLGLGEASQKAPDRSKIAERLVLSLVNEAVLCLDKGVAGVPGKEAARQIDLGTVMGTGFPPFRGGLIYYAEKRGAKNLLEAFQRLEQQHGARFKACDGIVRRAASGQSFYSA